MAPTFIRYCVQNGGPTFILDIIQQRPCTLQGGWAKVCWIGVYGITCRITDSAVNTFNTRIGLYSRIAAAVYRGNRIVTRQSSMMHPFGGDPFVKERVHICHQILYNWQVAKGLDFYFIIDQYSGHVCAARPAGYIVDHHGTTAAHAYAAGEPIAERGVGVLLNPGDNVEHRLAGV